MDKPSQHSDTNQYIKNLNVNKLSHKISKPLKKPSFDQSNLNPAPQPPPPPPPSSQPLSQNQNQNQQHQPPVYNINKNDFRDVVQKLTGSPAHERFSTPQPIQPPKPPSSRLQRIRPPPLPQLTHRPHPLLNTNSLPLQPPPDALNTYFHRPAQPISPLPPLPAHASAESPVSAYMRYLHNSIPALDSNKAFAGFVPLLSPRWSNQNQPPPLLSPRWSNQNQPPPLLSPRWSNQNQPPPDTALAGFQIPTSPSPFGYLNSPKSPYGLLSPGLLVSPSSFPLSPTLPLASPKWRGI